ncbi:MAG TPA: GWxTD domain-containing protein [Candidatus Binatus sp.]|jgi:GWxTD domain-containing protein|nr:GWxTD domain-containing protein [Candidatus Binatus sp.]
MRRMCWTILPGLLAFGFLLTANSAVAQDQQPSQSAPAKPQTAKDRKQQARKLAKESAPFTIWLTEEVIYIITKEEREAFLHLTTNEEREQFIEEFWRRRNPDPDSSDNAAREEHYRRIAYANERFSSGIPGWKTDRGRTYILWGPPDEIESHPAGGTYDRPPEQGGGTTTTYPWELWRYRHLEDIGENIEIEFVDPSGSGEYHQTMDPGEKDALAKVPGAGLSTCEQLGLCSKAQRFTNTNGTTLPAPLGGLSAGMDEFDNLERYFKVQRPPEHFKDLAEMVSVRILRNQIHMDYRFDFLRVTHDSVLVPITLQVANRDLSFQGKDGVQSAKLNLYGRITTLSGRVVQTFEDVVVRDFPDSLFHSSVNLSSIYQKSVPLRSGLYRLDVVLKDAQSGNVGVIDAALRVPLYEEVSLDASSLILADQIRPVPTTQIGQGPFVLGNYKVRPRINPEFSPVDKMGIFLQLYNLKLDAQSHKTNISVAYRILKGHQQVWQQDESSEQLQQSREQITLERNLPLSSLAPGHYSLEIYVLDLLTNQTVTRTADFTIVSPPTSKPTT